MRSPVRSMSARALPLEVVLFRRSMPREREHRLVLVPRRTASFGPPVRVLHRRRRGSWVRGGPARQGAGIRLKRGGQVFDPGTASDMAKRALSRARPWGLRRARNFEQGMMSAAAARESLRARQ